MKKITVNGYNVWVDEQAEIKDKQDLPTWQDVEKAIELARQLKSVGRYLSYYTKEEIIQQLKKDKL